MLLLTACAAPKDYDTEIPGAAGLFERYNARADRVERVWARASVDVRWVDEEGRKHSESGDGIFAFEKPDRFAMTLGKQVLGMWYWLGCDAERFWWFDLNPQDDRPNVAHVGRHSDLDRIGRRSGVPLPPRQLIELLGLTRLPAAAEQAAAEPVRVRGSERAAYTFRVPVKFAGRLAMQRVQIGAITARPLTIEFLDPEGRLLARSELSNYEPLKTPGTPLGAWPVVPRTLVATIPEHRVEIKVNLGSLTADPDKFSPALFDFEAIVADRKPDEVRELGADD